MKRRTTTQKINNALTNNLLQIKMAKIYITVVGGRLYKRVEEE